MTLSVAIAIWVASWMDLASMVKLVLSTKAPLAHFSMMAVVTSLCASAEASAAIGILDSLGDSAVETVLAMATQEKFPLMIPVALQCASMNYHANAIPTPSVQQ